MRNDTPLVELTLEEMGEVRGGYDIVLLAATWGGPFERMPEPAYATPIQLPSFA